jgi:hypothetical protein
MVTVDIPTLMIGAMLLGIVAWALYNHTHPQSGQK